MQLLPGLRLVRGYVYRELDELPVRSHRYGAARQRYDPGCSAARIHLAKHAGMKIMELLEKDIKPRDILTPAAFRNALAAKWQSAARLTRCCTCLRLRMKQKYRWS